MARPLRIEYPTACYHIINHGNRQQKVFENKRDNELFLEKLSEFAATFSVDVYAYCLMVNHFHLYIRTKEANLSRFMQSFLTSFTISKNRRDRSSGHLFQGRFKSVLVENELYCSRLSRYIHLNPVRTEEARTLNLRGKQRLLREFQWSSYAPICGLRKCPDWLKRDETLRRWGKSIKKQQSNYAKYVEEGLLRDVDDPMSTMAIHSVLGSDNFIDKMRKSLTEITANLNIRRELGKSFQLKSSYDFNFIADNVSEYYKIPKQQLLEKNTRNNEGRQTLIYLSSCYCRGKYTLTELANLLDITLGGFCRSNYNIKKRIQEDKELRTKIAAIENLLTKMKLLSNSRCDPNGT